jgi:Cellulase (glycosyl hydrolase family 5)
VQEPFVPYDNQAGPVARSRAHEINRRLGRGINLGNALDAREEQAPRLRLEQRLFDLVAAAGFDTVRLPVRWQAHAALDSPYAIAPEFLARVDWALDAAAARGLNVVVDLTTTIGSTTTSDTTPGSSWRCGSRLPRGTPAETTSSCSTCSTSLIGR